MGNLWSNPKPTVTTETPKSAHLSLASLVKGSTARIACVECECAARCERLMAYGLVQGQIIHLLQTYPAFVIRVDETELALDAAVARCVRVQPL